MSGAQLLTLGLPLDLNRATAADLDAMPGIGPALAQRIVDYRQAHGPFKKIEDFMEVSGIGPRTCRRSNPSWGWEARRPRLRLTGRGHDRRQIPFRT